MERVLTSPLEKAVELETKLASLERGLHEVSRRFPRETIVYGSLGRRLSVAFAHGVDSVDEYLDSHKRLGLSPRTNQRNSYDIDIAVPERLLDWDGVASIAREITHNCPGVEVDPHLMHLTDDGSHFISQVAEIKSDELNIFPIRTIEVKTKFNPVTTFDMWTHLNYLLSGYIRSQDAIELLRFIGKIDHKQDPYNLNATFDRLKRNESLRSAANLIRWPYHLFVPYSLRFEVAKIRGREANYTKLNFEREKPIYI